MFENSHCEYMASRRRLPQCPSAPSLCLRHLESLPPVGAEWTSYIFVFHYPIISVPPPPPPPSPLTSSLPPIKQPCPFPGAAARALPWRWHLYFPIAMQLRPSSSLCLSSPVLPPLHFHSFLGFAFLLQHPRIFPSPLSLSYLSSSSNRQRVSEMAQNTATVKNDFPLIVSCRQRCSSDANIACSCHHRTAVPPRRWHHSFKHWRYAACLPLFSLWLLSLNLFAEGDR